MNKKLTNNPLWSDGESSNFGKIAVSYAAGDDVLLDQALVQYECLVNQAHMLMLYKQKILTRKQVVPIIKVLEEIKKIDKQGKFVLQPKLEDVHSNIEQYVLDKLGIEIGGNLRLAIARNDQVYTDTRIFLREKIIAICLQITNLIETILIVAQKHTQTIMPGYTHLRISQPITYGHWLSAKAYHLLDDLDNLLTDFEQINLCPLGIFEMAGTHIPVDRNYTAQLLGFDGILKNSLYAANTRGEIELKVLSNLSLLALHIKRTLQEIILWSTHEFGLLTIDDQYTTGGTAQPNLKNPDTLEVMRANCSKVYSKFFETLMIMDGLPSGFNRDTQQTKPALFEAIKTIENALPVFGGIITSLKVDKKRMLSVAEINFSIAPDVTNQIAIKGNVSFRQAYSVVKTLIKKQHIHKSFAELTPKLLEKVSLSVLGKKISLKQKDIDAVSTAYACVNNRVSEGSPAPKGVKKMLQEIKEIASQKEQEILVKKQKIKKSFEQLVTEVTAL